MANCETVVKNLLGVQEDLGRLEKYRFIMKRVKTFINGGSRSKGIDSFRDRTLQSFTRKMVIE